MTQTGTPTTTSPAEETPPTTPPTPSPESVESPEAGKPGDPAPSRGRRGDLRRAMGLLRRYHGGRRPFVIGALLLALEALAAIVEPVPIAYVVDYLQGSVPHLRGGMWPELPSSAKTQTLFILCAGIILVAAVNSAADSLAEVCLARGGRVLGYRMRIGMYSHLQRLSLAYHDRRRTGDVLTRVTGDVVVVEDFIVNSVSNLLGGVLVLVGTFAVLFWQSWQVALIALIVVPLVSTVSGWFSRRLKALAKRQRASEGDLASTTQEMLTSIRLVQSYGRGSVDLERFSQQTDRSMRSMLGMASVQAQFSFVIALLEALAICAIVWIGVFLVDTSAISVGTLVFFILVLRNVFKPARKIVSEWYKVGKVIASVDRIVDLLDLKPEVTDSPGATPAPRLTGRLAFRDVTFAYALDAGDGTHGPAPPVLRHVDFEVMPGEVVALAGRSGAGKSTIAQLVPRLYDPLAGAVQVDDVDVRNYTLESLRAQVSLVLQDTVLLSGTVAENIGYGIEDPTREAIEAAARSANAHGFIESLPQGYDTVLGERGSTLSGGQRQRIAIARAFIRQSPILVLDEPTTGLDTDSTALVVEALRNLVRDRTTIIISHDVALMECADRLLEVRDGRIVEQRSQTDTTAAVPRHHDEASLELPHQGAPQVAACQSQSLAEAVARRIPLLGAALDEERARAEASAWAAEWAEGEAVEAVRVGSIHCRPDGGATLRYEIRTAGSQEQTLLVQVPPDGHELVVRPFPDDPGLPTLSQVVDPARARDLLAEVIPGADAADRCHVEVVHHPRTGPCVLRYSLSTPPGAPALKHATVYGKVYPDEGAERAAQALRLLRGELAPSPSRGTPSMINGFQFKVPQPLAVVPSLRLSLTEAIPGQPLLARLLREALRGGPAAEENGRRLHRTVAMAGRIVASVHRCDRPAGDPLTARDLDGEQAALELELTAVGELWPSAESALRRSMSVALGESGACHHGEGPAVLTHGDFTPSQLLLAWGRFGLVDVDTLCVAEPALDLGRFLAYLHVAGFRCSGDAAWPLLVTAGASFLNAYTDACRSWEAGRPMDDASLVHRVAAYRALTLGRMGATACRQLKDDRLSAVVHVLEAGDRWTRRWTT